MLLYVLGASNTCNNAKCRVGDPRELKLKPNYRAVTKLFSFRRVQIRTLVKPDHDGLFFQVALAILGIIKRKTFLSKHQLFNLHLLKCISRRTKQRWRLLKITYEALLALHEYCSLLRPFYPSEIFDECSCDWGARDFFVHHLFRGSLSRTSSVKLCMWFLCEFDGVVP